MLVVIVNFQHTGGLHELLNAIINNIIVREQSNYEVIKVVDDNLAIANINVRARNSIPRMIEIGGILMVIDGEIYSGDVESLAQIPCSLRSAPYGLFNVCVFNRREGKLFVVSDPMV